MKLKEVTHSENWFGEEHFNFHSNRFILFDKLGRELDGTMETVPNVLDLEVLEVKTGSCYGYFVGFPVTHIKLDYINENAISGFPLEFGGEDRRM